MPTFIICGTQRGGTTSLNYLLKQHPEICMAKKKEVHYFDLNYYNGIEWYRDHFKNCKNKKIKAIGEASPFYMQSEEVPERIKNILPNVKLIFILRNPVDRTYSNYWHEVNLGYEYLNFEEAIEKEEERLSKGDIFNKQHYSYKDRSKYIIQLKRFRKHFCQKQMLILINNEFRENLEQVMIKTYEFLGINNEFNNLFQSVQKNQGRQPRIRKVQWLKTKLPSNRIGQIFGYAIDIINLKKGYPPINMDTKEKLFEYFEPYNKELEEFLGKQLNEWYI